MDNNKTMEKWYSTKSRISLPKHMISSGQVKVSTESWAKFCFGKENKPRYKFLSFACFRKSQRRLEMTGNHI